MKHHPEHGNVNQCNYNQTRILKPLTTFFVTCLFFFFLFSQHLIPFKTVTNNSKCLVLLFRFYLCALQLLCCICFHSYRINKRFVTLQSFGNQKLHLRSGIIGAVSWCFCTVASLFFLLIIFFSIFQYLISISAVMLLGFTLAVSRQSVQAFNCSGLTSSSAVWVY